MKVPAVGMGFAFVTPRSSLSRQLTWLPIAVRQAAMKDLSSPVLLCVSTPQGKRIGNHIIGSGESLRADRDPA